MPKANPKAATLPAFTPVPRKCARHDGWTPERQQLFMEALADYGSVRAAANSVGMTPEGAYLLRRHPEAHSFRKAWKAALSLGVQRIEDVAMDRALNGVQVPVYAYGKIIGSRTVYNDRLLMFMLRNRAPKRFASDGAKGMNALDRHRLAQMKKEWRKEWERDALAATKTKRGSTLESLTTKLDLMRSREEAMMSPETLALRDAFEESRNRDRESGYAWKSEEDAARKTRSPAEDAEWEEPDDERDFDPIKELNKRLSAERRVEKDDGWELIDPDADESA
ncbi:hypothetical protein [Aurantiacibacter marinus]|uniref:hypothetical protein n=1 Tax=Aurantiacibacter marinus TaxID=874156 RepID=UPI00069A68E9|nr:hypothetical protein [Aurantiacibacter marinus]